MIASNDPDGARVLENTARCRQPPLGEGVLGFIGAELVPGVCYGILCRIVGAL